MNLCVRKTVRMFIKNTIMLIHCIPISTSEMRTGWRLIILYMKTLRAGNDLMDFLFDVYRLSKSLMAEDVVICLKLYEEDILNKTVLGIFIKCFDIETADKFFLFRDELFERHEYDVLYKIFMALRGSYD